MNNKTHITFIVDRSGSMGSCWDDVIGGYKHTDGMWDTMNTKLRSAREATDHATYLAAVNYTDDERKSLVSK